MYIAKQQLTTISPNNFCPVWILCSNNFSKNTVSNNAKNGSSYYHQIFSFLFRKSRSINFIKPQLGSWKLWDFICVISLCKCATNKASAEESFWDSIPEIIMVKIHLIPTFGRSRNNLLLIFSMITNKLFANYYPTSKNPLLLNWGQGNVLLIFVYSRVEGSLYDDNFLYGCLVSWSF